MAFESAFAQAFLYLAAALVAILVGKRLGLGAVLGYLIAGALIGPWGFGWIGREGEQVTHFAEFGVVMMLFLVGLELQPVHLWKMRREIFGLGSLQVVVSALAIAGVVLLLGPGWKTALGIGLILAMSSTAIVLQCLSEKNLLRTEAGQNSFAVLLFQDLAVIPIMAVLPLLAVGQAVTGHGDHGGHGSAAWMEHWPAWAQALATIAAVVIVVAIARLAVRPIFRAIAATGQREAFTAAALLLVIGIALLMTKVGLSSALGAFVAGVVLANSEYRHELESDLEPFKGLLLGLFFLGVGTGIDFGHIGSHWGVVFGGALALLVVKGGVIFALARLNGSNCASSLVFSSALAAGGEFAFVLIALAANAGVFPLEISRTLVAVVALTMAATPLLILAAHRFTARSVAADADERESDVHDQGAPVIICGFGRFGHAIGRLLQTQGIESTVLDNDSDQVETLRALGMPVFYGDASRPDLLSTAGAARARVLVVALRDADVTMKIVSAARQHYPHLRIFLRAYSRSSAYQFLDAGEQGIYRDTLDSSLRMGTDVLCALGKPAHAAHRAAKRYRKADEAFVREVAAHRHEHDNFVSAARDARVIFDEVMRADLQEHHPSEDAWSPPVPAPEKEAN
ncbi:monovalent cation:proton antiporter-2 (CPA2) family protein [Luteolibacter flavescens]|uniref:Monovalent cation:proton antiporter-2 (CPA2) family protein n=1 Tax=Luteolibacter flavescens TaxID=1859460 RepID=A0ABT3FLC0_9BACT|nr:monovalent cation:proton antiporter-2 (CPA2) family protein [Luteolibacter flavescens]MCW1884364.1 monovalent cation:proton antiporter-2 (CPA2) family protein [Luteolibacter flavescens]